jgi:hypothetical protein
MPPMMSQSLSLPLRFWLAAEGTGWGAENDEAMI